MSELGVPQPVRGVGRESPEPRAVDVEVGGAPRERGGANERVGEQEDRLGLHAGLAQQAPPLLANARMGALVRKHASRPRTGVAASETITPCRSRATPSGPTNSSRASQTDGSSSSSRIPSASHSR